MDLIVNHVRLALRVDHAKLAFQAGVLFVVA
jgi:hypothetical protein